MVEVMWYTKLLNNPKRSSTTDLAESTGRNNMLYNKRESREADLLDFLIVLTVVLGTA
jgi:hypothetical protein